ncbi:MAG: sensor histidine kinase, partial [Vicinamibacteria bacterium]
IITPVRDERGRLCHFIAIKVDMTERKHAEKILRERAEELARSNEDLERYAYVASHDLQEPLRMVSSFVQLLEKKYAEQLDEPAQQYIASAVQGAKRMHRLIKDLLAYSRAGRPGRPFEPVSCQEAVRAALSTLEMAVREGGAEVTVDRLPVVQGDRAQLEQLFQNLIGNAVKFHGENPPRVRIAARVDGADWLLSVSDNGIGIEAEYTDKIFAMFRRLHGGSDYPGTGIGLAICKRIVQRHGGRIWVESKPGEGSIFYFTIPRSEAARV